MPQTHSKSKEMELYMEDTLGYTSVEKPETVKGSSPHLIIDYLLPRENKFAGGHMSSDLYCRDVQQ